MLILAKILPPIHGLHKCLTRIYIRCHRSYKKYLKMQKTFNGNKMETNWVCDKLIVNEILTIVNNI